MLKVIVAVVVLAGAAVPPAEAGIYADDLAKCLVASTTTRDQTDLVRWIFATAALHPGVSSIAAVSAESALVACVARLAEVAVSAWVACAADSASRADPARRAYNAIGAKSSGWRLSRIAKSPLPAGLRAAISSQR